MNSIYFSKHKHIKWNSAYDDYHEWIRESINENINQESHLVVWLNFDWSKPTASIIPLRCDWLNLDDEAIIQFKDSLLKDFQYIKEPWKWQRYATIVLIVSCWKVIDWKLIAEMDWKKMKEYEIIILPTHNAIHISRQNIQIYNQNPIPPIS